MIWAILLVLGISEIGGGVWLDVPFVLQEKNGCGSASVWMVMQYWKSPGTARVEDIHRELFSKKANGIYARDMMRYLDQHGFRTFAFRGEWDDLAGHVSKGRPLIVCLERNARGVPLHYVVVAGVDRDRDLVWMNDPARRKLLSMSRGEFENAWSLTENWTLLAVPAEESIEAAVPPRAESIIDPSELSLASAAFRAENFAAAERQLQSILRANPSDSFANDFLGTTYLLDGNFDAALKYWNRAGKPRLREIRVDPPLRIDPVLLDHTFVFSRASELTLKDYHETRQRLDSLGIFTRYEFELTPADNEDFDLTLRASERNGARFLSWVRGLPYQSFYPQWWNAGGRAINMESLVRWDREKRRALVSVSSPLREHSGLGYRVQLDTRNENWQRPGETFNLRRTELTGDIRAVLNDRWNWTNGIALTRRSFTNALVGGTSFSYKTTAEYAVVRWAEKRLSIDASASAQAGKLFVGPSERFLKAEGDLSLRWLASPRREDYENRISLRAGKSVGALPFDELFILGLDRDSDLRLRGHSATADSGRKGAAPMGRDYLLLNYDFSKRLYSHAFLQIRGGPFLDAARISSQMQSLIDTGIQLRLSLLSAFTLSVSVGRDLRHGQNATFIN